MNALIQGYEKIAGRTLYPADPARLFILWVADIIVQERVNIDFSAKQNIPRYAEGEYLDSLAELFKGAERLEPEKARTTLQYTLSVPLEVATTVPAGTRATPDGEIVFATLEDLTIPAGQRTGNVEAECQTEGENGNGFVRIPIPNRNAPGYRNATAEKNSAVSRRKPDYERRASEYSAYPSGHLKRRSRTHREKNIPAQKQHPAPLQRGTG